MCVYDTGALQTVAARTPRLGFMPTTSINQDPFPAEFCVRHQERCKNSTICLATSHRIIYRLLRIVLIPRLLPSAIS